jgi:hypothetical protein
MIETVLAARWNTHNADTATNSWFVELKQKLIKLERIISDAFSLTTRTFRW